MGMRVKAQSRGLPRPVYAMAQVSLENTGCATHFVLVKNSLAPVIHIV